MPNKYKKKSFKPESEAKRAIGFKQILLEAINYSVVKRSTRELAEATSMDWATASKYLKQLKNQGLIKETIVGDKKTVWSKA